MLCNSVPWRIARAGDRHYQEYLKKGRPEYQQGYIPFDRLLPGSRSIMYRMLDPNPVNRWSALNVLTDIWVESQEVCHSQTDSPDKGDSPSLPSVTHFHKPIPVA
jgi:serine/threonine protein kinase